MEETEIKKLLGNQSPSGVRGWRCPDEIQLAAYIDQALDTADRVSLESHLVSCKFCLSQVAFLTQAADWEDEDEVPAALVSEARRVISQKPKAILNWDWRWVSAAAAAACFAVLFVLIALQMRRSQSISPASGPLVAQQASPAPAAAPQITVASPAVPFGNSRAVPIPKAKPPEAPVVRSKTVEDLLPKLITPRDGAVLRRSDLEFQWEPIPDAIFYDVRVMSAEGNLIFEEQTDNTRLRPGATALLIPGTKYFVFTRAHLRQGKMAKSNVVSFRVADK